MNARKHSKPHYEDVYLIIDCTENFYREAVTDHTAELHLVRIQRKQCKKGPDCNLTTLAASIVSEIFPGSKSDEDILRDSGIQSLAQEGDRWLTDKGFDVKFI